MPASRSSSLTATWSTPTTRCSSAPTTWPSARPPASTPPSGAPTTAAPTCKIAEIRGLEGAPPAKDRGDGFRAGLEAGGLSDANIVFSQNADWLREKAVPAAAAAFQAYPDVDVLYGHNDPMAEGAYIAAQDAGIDPSQGPLHRHRRPADPRRRHHVRPRRSPRRHLRLSHRRPAGHRLGPRHPRRPDVNPPLAGPALRHGLPGERAGGLQHFACPAAE